VVDHHPDPAVLQLRLWQQQQQLEQRPLRLRQQLRLLLSINQGRPNRAAYFYCPSGEADFFVFLYRYKGTF
jgi:hypothetical protein